MTWLCCLQKHVIVLPLSCCLYDILRSQCHCRGSVSLMSLMCLCLCDRPMANQRTIHWSLHCQLSALWTGSRASSALLQLLYAHARRCSCQLLSSLKCGACQLLSLLTCASCLMVFHSLLLVQSSEEAKSSNNEPMLLYEPLSLEVKPSTFVYLTKLLEQASAGLCSDACCAHQYCRLFLCQQVLQ